MLWLRGIRFVSVWVVWVVVGGLIVSGLDRALLAHGGEHTAVAEGSEHAQEPATRDRGMLIIYDDDDLQVRYGEYSETEFTLAWAEGRGDDYRRAAIDWQVVGSQLPAGLELAAIGAVERTRAVVFGTARFVGRWCFTLAARFGERRTSRQVCFFAAHNGRLSYPRFSSSARLDRAQRDRAYRDKIRFVRGNRRTRVSVAWHNLPSSLRVTTHNRLGYVELSGTPRDRDSHVVHGRSVSQETPPRLAELFTVKDGWRSRFAARGRYAYRVTAVYPDGETRAAANPSIAVMAGEVVFATITYDRRPFYFNVFRATGTYGDARFITRLTPQPSGTEYLLDSNTVPPRTLRATGNFYLMLKLTHTDRTGEVVSNWRQFSLFIDTARGETNPGRRYRCPSGYYYDAVLRHCVQGRGAPCPRGTYYEPADDACRSYPTRRYCPTGYYFDHFLRRCVLDNYPRCPWNYRWDSFYHRCMPDPYWCPLGFSYDWWWGLCLFTDHRCARGWHYDYGVKRCVRNHRACAPGYGWDRHTQSCQRNRRNCQVGYHWSARLNRCVYHGSVRCRTGYRYDTRRRECVRIGRARRCPRGEHWSPRHGRCIDNSRPTRRPTARPTRTPTRRPTARPTRRPTARPTRTPTRRPTARPTRRPTARPTARPTRTPTRRPTARPTRTPTSSHRGGVQ